MKLESIRDVVEYQQCCGCGACVWASPDTYEMRDVLEHGSRPFRKPDAPSDVDDSRAMDACPGIGLRHGPMRERSELLPELLSAWGPVIEVWEGHASDPALRFEASSGGAATALAIHAIEEDGMHGVIHIKAREDIAFLNRTVLSTTREELLEATGSRYAPASPCEGLPLVEAAPAPCVFIGKPCDVAGAFKARGLSKKLDENLGLTIAIFCAGTPSTLGTLRMLERMGAHPERVKEVRYRGRGWPGPATARCEDGRQTELTYEQSWGEILQRHRQWRCHVCADHTGEFADVSVGDPWYREIPPDEPGRSLILVRTKRGQRAVTEAINAGLLHADRADPRLVAASQPNLLKGRGAIWGRIVTLRLLGLPAPRFHGFSTWPFWLSELTLAEKLRSLTGTLRRVWRRGLYKRARTRATPETTLSGNPTGTTAGE